MICSRTCSQQVLYFRMVIVCITYRGIRTYSASRPCRRYFLSPSLLLFSISISQRPYNIVTFLPYPEHGRCLAFLTRTRIHVVVILESHFSLRDYSGDFLSPTVVDRAFPVAASPRYIPRFWNGAGSRSLRYPRLDSDCRPLKILCCFGTAQSLKKI